ncbi:hypothetical protein C7M84_013683 [Penaeus vannamei]|uniref:Uncharacterized protein n=1 Tax=Penaeus vannamei TaxID=6689 RepID=A0A423U9U0_PENVA|nr:hypothetical protein C7M84_013683 [Penaeus vannamei]
MNGVFTAAGSEGRAYWRHSRDSSDTLRSHVVTLLSAGWLFPSSPLGQPVVGAGVRAAPKPWRDVIMSHTNANARQHLPPPSTYPSLLPPSYFLAPSFLAPTLPFFPPILSLPSHPTPTPSPLSPSILILSLPSHPLPPPPLSPSFLPPTPPSILPILSLPFPPPLPPLSPSLLPPLPLPSNSPSSPPHSPLHPPLPLPPSSPSSHFLPLTPAPPLPPVRPSRGISNLGYAGEAPLWSPKLLSPSVRSQTVILPFPSVKNTVSSRFLPEGNARKIELYLVGSISTVSKEMTLVAPHHLSLDQLAFFSHPVAAGRDVPARAAAARRSAKEGRVTDERISNVTTPRHATCERKRKTVARDVTVSRATPVILPLIMTLRVISSLFSHNELTV